MSFEAYRQTGGQNKTECYFIRQLSADINKKFKINFMIFILL